MNRWSGRRLDRAVRPRLRSLRPTADGQQKEDFDDDSSTAGPGFRLSSKPSSGLPPPGAMKPGRGGDLVLPEAALKRLSEASKL